jgi:hypothetical protein
MRLIVMFAVLLIVFLSFIGCWDRQHTLRRMPGIS